MKSVKYLEKVKQRFELKTDSALADKLEVNKSAVSQYMSGKRVMEEEVCLRVALALEIEPVQVLMAAGIDRAEKTGQKSLWEVFSMRTATPAAVLLALIVNLFLTPGNAEAAPRLAYSASQESNTLYYVKSLRYWLRRKVSKIAAWFAPALCPATP